MGPCLAQVIEQRILLDVLTPLSDCRQEIVEKIMERRISGVSCMCWIDFHNGIWGCGFLCARLRTLYFCLYFVSLFPATTPRATTPHLYRTGHHAFTTTAQLPRLGISRVPRQGLPRPILTTTGYHACVFIPVITPELSRSTTQVHRVITPSISNSYFVVYLHRL